MLSPRPGKTNFNAFKKAPDRHQAREFTVFLSGHPPNSMPPSFTNSRPPFFFFPCPSASSSPSPSLADHPCHIPILPLTLLRVRRKLAINHRLNSTTRHLSLLKEFARHTCFRTSFLSLIKISTVNFTVSSALKVCIDSYFFFFPSS